MPRTGTYEWSNNRTAMKLNVDLRNLYNTYFQKSYYLEPRVETTGMTCYGLPVKEQVLGREVFLPVTFKFAGRELTIACATIRVTGKKNVVKTIVAERKGTVKEQFSVGDYEFTIKGVLIGDGDSLPDVKMIFLKEMFESTKPVELHNAIADFFLDKSLYVLIESIEFPEVEGKTLRHRPFSVICESDYVDSLKV